MYNKALPIEPEKDKGEIALIKHYRGFEEQCETICSTYVRFRKEKRQVVVLKEGKGGKGLGM